MLAVIGSVVLVVLVAGFLIWLLQFLPVAEPFPAIAKGLIIFAVIAYVVAVLFGWTTPIALHH